MKQETKVWIAMAEFFAGSALLAVGVGMQLGLPAGLATLGAVALFDFYRG